MKIAFGIISGILNLEIAHGASWKGIGSLQENAYIVDASIVIGVACFFSYYIAYFFACYSSNWECVGDNAGGIMMLYGIVVLPFMIVLCLLSIIIVSIQFITLRSGFLRIHFIGLIVYAFSLSLIMQPSLTTLYGSSLSIIVCIASIIAIIGYIKKSSWSKILSFIIIGFQAILTICTGVYLALFTALGVSVLIPYLSFGLPLLFLAFKMLYVQCITNTLKIVHNKLASLTLEH